MTDPKPTCDRCGAHLRCGNGGTLCAPCDETIASCLPYIEVGREQAPEGVNLLELVAGIMLTHDALHPGEKLYLREALAEHGVEVDHVRLWQAVGKLKRRHRLIVEGEPREPGYRVVDWMWTARRTRSSVAATVAQTTDNEGETGNRQRREDAHPTLFQAQPCTE